MLIYTLIFILLLFILTRYWKVFQIEGLSDWTIPVVFLMKVAVGLALFLIHVQAYEKGELSHDGANFLKEGKYLNDVFYQSPKHYFQLLTGIGESTELINKYLSMTKYWSAGDLTLINDSKNVIRVHSIIHFVSRNAVIIHLSLICLLTLLAVKNIYLAFRKYSKQTNVVFFWILLLIPSTIFWTSGILKEPFLFFGISLMARSLLVPDIYWKRILLFISSLMVLIFFKPYILVCMLIALFCFAVYKYLFHSRLIPSLLTLLSLLITLAYTLEKPTEKIVHHLTRKQFDFVNIGKGGIHVLADTCFYYFQPHQYKNLYIKNENVILIKETKAFIIEFGSTKKPVLVYLKPNGKIWKQSYYAKGSASVIEITPINDSPIQLVKNIPEALTNSIFRPFFNDPGSSFKYLSFFEVWYIIIFFIYALLFKRKLDKQEKGIVFTLLIFALLLFLLIGWTTPVLGAITRYRFPAQLALIIVSLILLKPINFNPWKNSSS